MSAPPSNLLLVRLNRALEGRFVLEREIGSGGMGTVFLARDVRHDRQVAVKVLRPELASVLGAERFLREVRVAAQLQHPHILQLHDSGEADGLLFYVMPFVDGESLRQRLDRLGTLAVPEAVRILRDVVDALGFAHEHGVIHRDIKPDNILLQGRHALVADFGVAKALQASTTATTLTTAGIAIGTPAYMAPEQAMGDADIDQRADLYAVGAMGFEMLIGEPPLASGTPQGLLTRKVIEEAPAIDTLRADLPPALSGLVMRALARRREDRWASANEMSAQLESLATPSGGSTPTAARLPGGAEKLTTPADFPAGSGGSRRPARRSRSLKLLAALALAAVVAGTLIISRVRGATAIRLAVLPFETLGDSADSYLSDGIADDVRGKLATLPTLQVISRSGSSPYRKTAKTPTQIGSELRAQYLLTGTVRWEIVAGTKRAHVNSELVQVSTASTRWEQAFDVALSDIFDLQTQVVEQVAQSLQVPLAAADRRHLAERTTSNLAAYEAYLRGEDLFFGDNAANYRQAAAYFAQATALDTSFSLAWAKLSVAHRGIFAKTGDPAEGEAARVAAERALALQPNSAAGHWARGEYNRIVLGDLHGALAEFRRAMELAPYDGEMAAMAARVELGLGQWDVAAVHYENALALDPGSYVALLGIARVQEIRHQYRQALASFDRALQVTPVASRFSMYATKATVYVAQGDVPGVQALVRAAEREVDPAALVAYLADGLDLTWALDDADQRLLLTLSPAAFDNDRMAWGLDLAETAWLRGDRAAASAYADSVCITFQSHSTADSAWIAGNRFGVGLALAYLGRRTEALREIGAGERGYDSTGAHTDAWFWMFSQYLRAKAYVLAGDEEKALNRLQHLLAVPTYFTPAYLRADPAFAPLKGDPRFERLLASAEKQ